MTETEYERMKSFLKIISQSIPYLCKVKLKYFFNKDCEGFSYSWNPSRLAFSMEYDTCNYEFNIFTESDGEGITFCSDENYKSIDIDLDALNDVLECDLIQIRLMNPSFIPDIEYISFFLDKIFDKAEIILKDLIEFSKNDDDKL